MAGKWLKYRGHLENISGNLFLGAVNAFTAYDGTARTVPTARPAFPEIAKRYSEQGIRWVRHRRRELRRGLSPRARGDGAPVPGGVVIIARSFARIHETNLKKQGLLPLTFADPATYDLIGEDDRINVLGLADLVPGCRCAARS
jgi:aconitate hydratase